MSVPGVNRPTLLIGGSGFLGKAVARRFDTLGHKVTVTTRSGAGDTTACDVGDPEMLGQLLSKLQPSVIVNCAVIPDFAPQTLARQYPVNVLAPGVMALYAKATGAHLVQASASLIYGAKAVRVDDSSPVAPDTDYGHAKLLAENLIAASGCRASVLQFCGLYGVGGPSHLGLNRAIDAARQGSAPVIAGSGMAKRNYLFIDDAADAVENVVTQRLTGVWRVASDEVLTIADIMKLVCSAFLPEKEPHYRDGPDAEDQIIVPSADFLKTRSMAEALAVSAP